MFVIDVTLSLLSLDTKFFRDHFYYVEGGGYSYRDGRELYQSSDESEVLYQLKPNYSVDCDVCVNPLEDKFSSIRFSTTKEGYRKTVAQPEKYQKVILFIGGSNFYGVSVRGDYTLPSLLQKFFNEERQNYYYFENLSMNAQVLSQKVAIAERYIASNGIPDTIIFQYSNVSRRPFFIKKKR